MKNSFVISVRFSILIVAHGARDAVVVDLPFVVDLQEIHVGRHQDVVEGLDQVEQQPYVDHLDVSRLGKVVADIDEHGCEDQHRGDIDRYNRLKEKLLEVVGRVANNIEDDCRRKYS